MKKSDTENESLEWSSSESEKNDAWAKLGEKLREGIAAKDLELRTQYGIKDEDDISFPEPRENLLATQMKLALVPEIHTKPPSRTYLKEKLEIDVLFVEVNVNKQKYLDTLEQQGKIQDRDIPNDIISFFEQMKEKKTKLIAADTLVNSRITNIPKEQINNTSLKTSDLGMEIRDKFMAAQVMKFINENNDVNKNEINATFLVGASHIKGIYKYLKSTEWKFFIDVKIEVPYMVGKDQETTKELNNDNTGDIVHSIVNTLFNTTRGEKKNPQDNPDNVLDLIKDDFDCTIHFIDPQGKGLDKLKIDSTTDVKRLLSKLHNGIGESEVKDLVGRQSEPKQDIAGITLGQGLLTLEEERGFPPKVKLSDLLNEEQRKNFKKISKKHVTNAVATSSKNLNNIEYDTDKLDKNLNQFIPEVGNTSQNILIKEKSPRTTLILDTQYKKPIIIDSEPQKKQSWKDLEIERAKLRPKLNKYYSGR